MKASRMLLVVLALGLLSGSALATQLVLQNGLNSYTGCQDTYLHKGKKEYGFGASDIIRIQGEGISCYGIGLMKYDISGIPAGQTIQTATLRMYFGSHLLTGWQRFRVYPMLVDTNFGTQDNAPAPVGITDYQRRGQVTTDWAQPVPVGQGPQPGDPAGNTANADFDFNQSWASQNHSYGSSGFGWTAGHGWVETDITDLVAQWYSGALDPSQGMALFGDASQQAGYYWSSENAAQDLRPQLVIDYVPEPTTIGLLVLGGVALIRRRRA